MKLKFLIITLFTFAMSFAQNKGTVTGTIADKDLNNEPLPFATILIKGTQIGTNTDENGKYTLSVPAGSHTLIIDFLGYEAKEVPFTVKAGETKTINEALGSTSVVLEGLVMETTINREKESALLTEQKKAVVIKQTIGAQEMSRKGVSDAEGAVTKMTGVTKQQGAKNVFVRGLGDRYNSTTMNGMPLPSEDPSYKNISLDFFTSNIIKNIGVNKTFGSEIYGDVGGANIDIVSKELSGNEEFEIGISTGVNTQTVSKDFLKLDGGNWFGTVADKEAGITNLNSYDFANKLNPNTQSTQINTGANASYGKRFDFENNNSFTMYLVGAYSNDDKYREGKIRQTTSIGTVYQDQDYKKYTYNVSQTLMGNFKYRFENSNTISYNSLYIHSNSQSVGDYLGPNNPEQEGDVEFLRRQQMNNNNLWVNQLLSTIALNEKIDLDLGASYNMIRTTEPDRRSNKYLYRNGNYTPSTNSAGDNERYFADLNEDDFAGKAVASYKFENEGNSKLDVGYNFRHTTRDFSALIFNHRFSTLTSVDINDADGLFNQENLDNGVFQLQTGRGTMNNPRVFEPFTYNGTRTINAALTTFTHNINNNLVLVVGGRFEKVLQEVEYDTNISNSDTNGKAKIDKSYVLPNLNLKYTLNDKNILRLAGSMSYTLPQFKEVAPFKYQDVSFSSQGNPGLIPSENYNADIKWEFYPKDDEIIAITGFYKHIKNPIARSEIPSGGNTLTYLNVGGTADAMGVELEAKKNIYKVTSDETGKETVLSAGANISYLHTRQDLENPLPQFTNSEDKLQGASPLLVNADLTYNLKNEGYSLTSSVVMNYFSDRIYSIGTRGFSNIVEKGIPTLDFITQTSLGEHFGISLKAKNLLNPDFRLTRESNGNTNPDTVLSTYKLGLDFSLGLTYKF